MRTGWVRSQQQKQPAGSRAECALCALCLTRDTGCWEFRPWGAHCWQEVVDGAMPEFQSEYGNPYFFGICISVIKFEALARLHLNKAKGQGVKYCAVRWPNPNPTKSGNVSTDSPGVGLDPCSCSCPLSVPAPTAEGTRDLPLGHSWRTGLLGGIFWWYFPVEWRVFKKTWEQNRLW